MLLVQLADEIAHLRAEHAFERPLLRRHYVHLELARTQRRRDFEADKARADHDRALALIRRPDDGAAVGERAQHTHMQQVGSRCREPHRFGAGREQKPVVGQGGAVREGHRTGARIDLCDTRLEPQVDVALLIEIIRAQRQPILRRAAGQIVLGEVGPIDRRRVVVAQHDDAALVVLAPQHLGCREAGRTAADDNDPVRGA